MLITYMIKWPSLLYRIYDIGHNNCNSCRVMRPRISTLSTFIQRLLWCCFSQQTSSWSALIIGFSGAPPAVCSPPAYFIPIDPRVIKTSQSRCYCRSLGALPLFMALCPAATQRGSMRPLTASVSRQGFWRRMLRHYRLLDLLRLLLHWMQEPLKQ